ncbi:MAG: NusG domain II-containing protein [Blautia sp.]|nr:NusG domain II-containing protein [Blautia sp.]
MKKKDYLVIGTLLLLALLSWLLLQNRGKDYGGIRITVDSRIFGEYSLAEDQIIPIGDTNVCEIRDGRAFMTEATCPDHLCIHQKSIGSAGGAIICLPNRVIIESVPVSGQEGPQIDAFVS